jgi:hypothetical protein
MDKTWKLVNEALAYESHEFYKVNYSFLINWFPYNDGFIFYKNKTVKFHNVFNSSTVEICHIVYVRITTLAYIFLTSDYRIIYFDPTCNMVYEFDISRELDMEDILDLDFVYDRVLKQYNLSVMYPDGIHTYHDHIDFPFVYPDDIIDIRFLDNINKWFVLSQNHTFLVLHGDGLDYLLTNGLKSCMDRIDHGDELFEYKCMIFNATSEAIAFNADHTLTCYIHNMRLYVAQAIYPYKIRVKPFNVSYDASFIPVRCSFDDYRINVWFYSKETFESVLHKFDLFDLTT